MKKMTDAELNRLWHEHIEGREVIHDWTLTEQKDYDDYTYRCFKCESCGLFYGISSEFVQVHTIYKL